MVQTRIQRIRVSNVRQTTRSRGMYGITDAQLNEWIARKTARQCERMQADDPFLKGEDAE